MVVIMTKTPGGRRSIQGMDTMQDERGKSKQKKKPTKTKKKQRKTFLMDKII